MADVIYSGGATDTQVVVDKDGMPERGVKVMAVSGDLLYDGGATDTKVVVQTDNGPEAAEKVYNLNDGGGSWPTSKVIVKANSLPIAEIKYVGSMYIYAGETTAAYKHGYIYEGTSTPANTKSVSFSPNTISCTGENFWAFWKSEEGAPNNYTEIVKGEMVLIGGNTWRLIGRNTNNEIVKSYQQYDGDWEALGFTFTGAFSEGDVVYFDCAINETDDIIYWWQRIDVQPAGTSSSTGIAVDDQLSFVSQNPVQNKVITEALSDVGYSDWQKPADWVDIRQGAINNSVYLLVAHKADFSKYNELPLSCSTENGGTYDVYIDGIKTYSAQTSSDSTAITLNWQTLNLTSGWDVTYPEALRTHIVRVTPTSSAETIKHVRCQYSGSQKEFGILWVHYELNYAIGVNGLLGSWNGSKLNTLCQAITAQGDKLTLHSGYGLAGFIQYSGVKHIPIIDGNNAVVDIGGGLGLCNISLLRVQNLNSHNFQLYYVPNLKKVEATNCKLSYGDGCFRNCPLLENLPPDPSYYAGSSFKDISNLAAGCTSLEDTFLDFSGRDDLKGIRFGGTQAAPLTGIKGVTVSPSAPFDSTTSPQINVSYTGMDRAALVTLFNSLPTVSASQVCNVTGCTGAADLTASDLAIATAKGWTVTR